MINHKLIKESCVNVDMPFFIENLENEVNNFNFSIDQYIKDIPNDNSTRDDICFIGALCSLYLAYTYGICERCEHWDDRNKASSIWAYEHKEALLSFIEHKLGKPFPWKPVEYRFQQYFINDVDWENFADSNCKNGIEKWARTHHTLQQRMMIVFARLLAAANIGGFEDSKDSNFAFI